MQANIMLRNRFTAIVHRNILVYLESYIFLLLNPYLKLFITFVSMPVYTTKPYTHKLVLMVDYLKIKFYIDIFYILGSLVNFKYPIN